MDRPEAPCSSVQPRAAAARELLLAALEDLSQEQLKRFRHKLRDAPVDGRSIPWGRLERADAVDLADQLTQFYGPEPALDVARKTLKRADARDIAAWLKEQRLQRLGPSSAALLSVSEYKRRYREHVLRQHAKVKERNARSVKITKRFTKLLIAEGAALECEAPEPGGDEPQPERARRSDTHTFNRLFSRDEDGQRPLTVVLQGPAGIGKTMAAKKILYDWAAGKLYQGKVDFAFFMPCAELLERPSPCSLADLVLDQCPDRSAPVRQMLKAPERLLFILDGADELPAPGPAEAAPCTDPFEAAGGARVLGGLLSKVLLPKARLLVTTRAAAPARLQGRLCSPQCAEVRGFSDKDKKKYFYKFFQDEHRAERAYRFVKENETLFALCFVPFVCWIVCTVLRQQLDRGQDLSRTSKTTTSVYLLFIVSVLSPAPASDGPRLQGELRKLCRLAREGVLERRAHFAEKDLERLQLRGSKVQTLFLSKKELPGVLQAEVTYQFIDQSFQEFLAALSYLLEDEGPSRAPAGGVQELLQGDQELCHHLALTTRFLFGLLSAERLRDIERHFGCVVPERVKQDVLKWVQDQGQRRPRVAPEGAEETNLPEGTKESESDSDSGSDSDSEGEGEGEAEAEEEAEEEEFSFPLALLYCLYETQESAFVRQALRGHPALALERLRLSRLDVAVLSYCVRCCPAGQALRLTSCALPAPPKKKKKSLVKRLQNSLSGSSSQGTTRKPQASPLRPFCEALMDRQCGLTSLTLSRCKLPDWACRDLAEALRQAPALAELNLLHNGLSEGGLRALSEGLAWPGCRVQTLRLQQPGLQDGLQPLVGLLRHSPALTSLDLSGCRLSEPMVTYLCAVLQHPGCRLQTLSLTSVELSAQSLEELQAVRTAKPGLVIAHPALDSRPEPVHGFSTAL
ncbi:NACHT, LRR and PYD domains-containing protein 6 [Pteronotus mesoamericanus]|uniref:NACHT, LRR and PYD domains-containing protein 6 n=1 Tax=Pteronotus mesoamericanus TaxID=1884717 RepID=UPI0023EC0B2A|nr:NACHT, LRR and PYD domains-containing protein 6 [Pteronotus parnellii mesoamericanus]